MATRTPRNSEESLPAEAENSDGETVAVAEPEQVDGFDLADAGDRAEFFDDVSTDALREELDARSSNDFKERTPAEVWDSMLDGLPSDSADDASFYITRINPKRFNGKSTFGYCGSLYPPANVEDLRKEFGGGLYRIELKYSEISHDGQLVKKKIVEHVNIVGDPILGSLLKERENDSPEVNAAIQMQQQLQQQNQQQTNAILERLAVEQAKPSALERALEKVMDNPISSITGAVAVIAKVKELWPSPPPVVTPAAPAQVDAMQAFGETLQQVASMKNQIDTILGKLTPKEAAATDDDDDGESSVIGDITRGLKEFNKLQDTMKETAEGVAGTPAVNAQPAAAAATATQQSNEQMEKMLQDLTGLVWRDFERKTGRPSTTAKKVLELIDSSNPALKAWILEKLDSDVVTQLLANQAETPERVERMNSKRGKVWITNFVKAIRGERPADEQEETEGE